MNRRSFSKSSVGAVLGLVFAPLLKLWPGLHWKVAVTEAWRTKSGNESGWICRAVRSDGYLFYANAPKRELARTRLNALLNNPRPPWEPLSPEGTDECAECWRSSVSRVGFVKRLAQDGGVEHFEAFVEPMGWV